MKYTITVRPEDYIKESTVYDFRFKLKMELLEKRGYKSDLSGTPLTEQTGCHMHEGIIPRNKVPKSIWWHLLIFSELNCFLLTMKEHEHPPDRQWCIQKAIEYYGYDALKEWYDSLPFKSRPFILL